MKKTTIIILLLIISFIAITACDNKSEQQPDNQELGDYRPMIFVNDRLYGDVGVVMISFPDESNIIGTVLNVIPQNVPMLLENFTANTDLLGSNIMAGTDDLSIIYVQHPDGHVIQYEEIKDETAPPAATEPFPSEDTSSIKVLYNRIGWWYDMDDTEKVQSVSELQEFYETLKINSLNEIDDDLAWRFTEDGYNNTFFEEYLLLFITVSEMSGSNRHELVSIEENSNILKININRQIPEVQSDDMAGWLIIIELSKNYSDSKIDVTFNDVKTR